MTALDPKALAEQYDEQGARPEDVRPGVQRGVDAGMIYQYVLDTRELPPESAKPFSEWLHSVWFDFADEDEAETTSNKQVIDGALESWCGGRRK
jgi:hypothetical protein